LLLLLSDEDISYARDRFRWHLACLYPIPEFQENSFCSPDLIFDALLKVEFNVVAWIITCSLNHTHQQWTVCNMTMNIVAGYSSIQDWFAPHSYRNTCQICQKPCSVQHNLLCCPPMLVFCMTGVHLQIEHTLMLEPYSSNLQSYSLAGVIYFGQNHFISRIILTDNTVWIHDGIIGCQSAFEGILGQDINLNYCQGKVASYAVYVLDI
jgi:hypothetical protein